MLTGVAGAITLHREMPDPYQTLGVSASASDAELRAAYRHLVQLHHPDHNGGSAVSARRFEEVQEAYAAVRRLRDGGSGRPRAARPQAPTDPAPAPGDPDLDARLAAMERELRDARDARERAVRDARQAQEQTLRDVREMATDGGGRASDEELGYVTTDDSLTKILDDAAAEFSDRFGDARGSPAAHRVADLLDELSAKLRGEDRKPK
jgi:curved DNA-binding protein CbpA